jgi:hypothetical protein
LLQGKYDSVFLCVPEHAVGSKWKMRVHAAHLRTYGGDRSSSSAAEIRSMIRKQRIFKVLDLEDTGTQSMAAFAIERSKGVFLAPAAPSFSLLYLAAEAEIWRLHIWQKANQPGPRSSTCQHGMATSPDPTGYANRRSLAGNASKNCWSAQQMHACQQPPQSVGSRGSRASHAGSFSNAQNTSGQAAKCLSPMNQRFQGICMPRGRSTFTKRQKEHTRQQRQRDKAERKNQRKQQKAVAVRVDEMAELREHATAQATPFNVGAEDSATAEESSRGDRIGE